MAKAKRIPPSGGMEWNQRKEDTGMDYKRVGPKTSLPPWTDTAAPIGEDLYKQWDNKSNRRKK